MSQEQGIKLNHQPHDAGYRLIELPPELESLLESEAAPVLTLESADSSAVLKTADKSYAIRQKNTSNALFLLSPATSPSDPQPCLSIISTIHETVELDAVSESPISRAPLKDTGSKGKWHERFGKNR
ncbi:Sister chromatid cohesion protein DCC1 [Purpureocillium lilacinum]|uniref:Sister chromatid cohesion protein DCC1 n=1 Tax=Purpureocillium lilacinum TaxID=33203 RepID=A0A179HI96_PURLI|nr:Sister chromatid cohesion protein DCC1 [Purpureocillium lilacinum]OAQ90055.1 Sister chromatid cohesion protein DCC1 [Purpureocillium lilacinum]